MSLKKTLKSIFVPYSWELLPIAGYSLIGGVLTGDPKFAVEFAAVVYGMSTPPRYICKTKFEYGNHILQ